MASVYFKSRSEAGRRLAELIRDRPLGDSAVVSLSVDAALIALELARALECPMQLYLEESISIPGGLQIGSVDQDGGFRYASDISTGHQDYFYQEFRGYIEETKRASFSSLNRELKGRETLRKDLLHGRHIFVVADCLQNLVPVTSFIASIKSVEYDAVIVCAPLIMSKDVTDIKQISPTSYFMGALDFFYGADHYFEDNSVIDREKTIEIVSDTLKLWPLAA